MYNQDDFITWLLVNAPESDHTVEELTRRLLAVNFAAIHTSALNMGHALYWLLARYVARCLSNSLFSPANRNLVFIQTQVHHTST
jgi:hypothetical protein